MQELQQYKDGDISFETFYRATRKKWAAMATTQHKKLGHRMSGSADREDILQEMLMSIPKSVAAYDAQAGTMNLSRFVVWHAYAAAKDFVNQQCGAYKGRTSEPPRAPVAAASLADHVTAAEGLTGEDMLERLSAVEQPYDDRIDVCAVREQIVRSMVDHVVMDSMLNVGASLQDMADAIYENESLRTELNLGTRTLAYGLVRRTTKRFVERAAQMA